MNTYTGWAPFNKTKAVSEIHTNSMHYMLNNHHHSILFLVSTYQFTLTWNDQISVVSQDLVLIFVVIKKNNLLEPFPSHTIHSHIVKRLHFPCALHCGTIAFITQHTQKLCIMSGLSILYFITFLVRKQYTLKTCNQTQSATKDDGKIITFEGI